MSHRVRVHKWENGVLRTLDHFFEQVEEALEFSTNFHEEHVKVYDPSGQVIAVATPSAAPAPVTYA